MYKIHLCLSCILLGLASNSAQGQGTIGLAPQPGRKGATSSIRLDNDCFVARKGETYEIDGAGRFTSDRDIPIEGCVLVLTGAGARDLQKQIEIDRNTLFQLIAEQEERLRKLQQDVEDLRGRE